MRKSIYLALLFSGLLHGFIFLWGSRTSTTPIAFQAGDGAIEISAVTGEGTSSASSTQQPATRSAGVLEGGSALGIAPPQYPQMSRVRGEQGSVLLRLQFNEREELIEAEVIESSGFSALDASALAAVKNGLRAAAEKSITHERKIRFRFELKNGK